jgi:hypothetical protein
MINLTFTVSNITSVTQIFDRIQVRVYTGEGTPTSPVTDLVEYATIDGYDTINGRDGVSDVLLRNDISQYYYTHASGTASNWYISRYYNASDYSSSGWSDPILGEPGDLYYDPVYAPEIVYGTADQLIIDRIRLYIGDPIDIRREYGEEALSSIHPDGKTYELDEKGWPTYITMGGKAYTSSPNPSVNGYRFLRFNEYIDDVCTTCSSYVGNCGEDVTRDVTYGVDIWYYTFRHSDRQIMEAYDSCPPPSPLTTTTANSEVYMVQTAIDLLRKELWEDATEDGAKIGDEGSTYDPSPGLEVRRKLLDDLIKRRDDLVKALQLTGITGVLID